MKFILIIIVFISAQFSVAAPSNDNFANAEVLTGAFSTVSGDGTGATREIGEPLGGRSVWYKWTAPEFGTAEFGVYVDAFTYSSANYVHVFVGSELFTLTEVTQFSGGSELRGRAIVGKNVTYYIQLTGVERSNPATFRLFVNLDTTGFDQTVFQRTSWTNDLFSQAELLTGTNAKAIGYPSAATREPGEPTSSGFKTLWWKWTAPTSGVTIFSTVGGDTQNSLTVGSGNQVYDLDYVEKSVSGNAEIAVKTTMGRTYIVSIGLQSSGAPQQALLSVIHSSTSSISSGSGVGGRFTTLSRDILNMSRITGVFTTIGITGLNIKVPAGFFIRRDPFINSTKKWSFIILKEIDTVTAKSATIVVEGLKNGKPIVKLTKTFKVW